MRPHIKFGGTLYKKDVYETEEKSTNKSSVQNESATKPNKIQLGKR